MRESFFFFLARLARLARPARFALIAVSAALVSFALAASACTSPPPGTIGAGLGRRTDGRVFFRTVPPGQGAEKAGVRLDDELVAIDGKPVRDMGEADIKKAVRGDLGSTFTVTIERDGQRRDVKIERSAVLADRPEKK